MPELDQLIERLTRLLSIMEDQVLTHKELSGLTMRQLNYLDLIRSIKNPTVSDLVRSLEVAKPTVTITLKELMNRGFVRKIQSQKDKRVYHLELTEKGKKINKIHDSAHRKIVRKIFTSLDEKEINHFENLVEKIVNESEEVNLVK